jgi:uncharacterized protein YjbJ (UPF0337 family)
MGKNLISSQKEMLTMNDHNGLSDKMKSGVSKAKGEVKDQVGNATGNSRLQAEGKKDKLKGEIQEKIGELKSR